MSKPTVWVNKRDEDQLRVEGYQIPPYPETGAVTKDGQVIGHMNNFDGLVISDTTAIPELRRIMPNAGFWNCP